MAVSPDDSLYHRVKKRNPRLITPDLEDPTRCLPSPAALRLDDGKTMSSHLHSILEQRGRDVATLYPADTYGSVTFPASTPIEAGGAVEHTPVRDPQVEPDEDRAAAHCDVMPLGDDLKTCWDRIRLEIIHACSWVQSIE